MKADRYSDKFIFFFCIFAAFIAVFAFVQFGGMIVGDESYQAVMVRRYAEAPLAMLSFYIGHLWTSVFGFSLYNLRILVAVEMFLAVGITSFYLFRKTHNLKLTGFVFLLGCVILRFGSPNFYNWDTGNFLFESLSLYILLIFIEKPKISTSILLGIAVAFMSLGRLPSAIFLPAAMIIAWKAAKTKESKRFIAFAETGIFTGWILTILILVTIMTGSPANFIESFNPNNIISGHSPIKDLSYLWDRFQFIMAILPKTWAWGIGCLLLSVIMPKFKHRKNALITLSIWVLLCTLFSYWESIQNRNLQLFLGIGAPLGLGLLFALPVYALFRKEHTNVNSKIKWELWGCGMVLFSMAFGSDGYTERLISGFVIPALIAILWQVKYNSFRVYLKSFIVVTASTFFMMFAAHAVRIAGYFYRNTEMLKTFPVKGLYTEDPFLYEIEGTNRALHQLRTRGIPYIYLGNRRGMELFYGEDEGPSINNYHTDFNIKKFWDKTKNDYLDKVDATVIYDTEGNLYQKIAEDEKANEPGNPLIISQQEKIRDLRDLGFTETEIIDKAIILYRKERQNPNKRYPDISKTPMTSD